MIAGDNDPNRPEGAPSRPSASGLVGEPPDNRLVRFAGVRYTRFVKWMKAGLVGLAIILVGLVLAWPYFRDPEGFHIGFAALKGAANQQPGMDNARYVGSDDQNRPFSVSADRARLEQNADGIIQLEMPKADLILEDGSWLMVTAESGRYIRKDKMLELTGEVNLFHDTGYELHTPTLNIDLGKGSAEGTQPVTGQGPFGKLNSKGLEIFDKGRIVRFSGPADVLFFPAATQPDGDPQ